MSHHTQFVNQFALRLYCLGNLVQHPFSAVKQLPTVARKENRILEGNEHIICPLGDGHLLLQVILCAVFIQCRRNLCESLLHILFSRFYLILSSHSHSLRRRLPLEALHKLLPFLFINCRHAVQHNEKAKQQGYHIAIGIHPVCATATALFSFHAVSPLLYRRQIIIFLFWSPSSFSLIPQLLRQSLAAPGNLPAFP